MANQYLAERLEGIRTTLLAHYSAGAPLPSSTRGSEREIVLREFLEKVLPAGVRFGSGAVTDAAGHRSGQLDIVVEHPFLPSFPMLQGNERLYLAESVALVISVKSNLSAQWTQLEREAQSLRTVRRGPLEFSELSGSGIDFGVSKESSIPLLAIGYTGYQTLESLVKRLESSKEDRRPDGALAIESGAFFGFGIQASGHWGLLAAILVVLNSVKRLRQTNVDLLAYARSEPPTV